MEEKKLAKANRLQGEIRELRMLYRNLYKQWNQEYTAIGVVGYSGAILSSCSVPRHTLLSITEVVERDLRKKEEELENL